MTDIIKTNIKLITKQVVYALVGVATLLAYFPSVANAGQITARKVTIGNSTAGATTTYVFNFNIPSAALIKSIAFNACDQPSGSCTHTTSAAGFDGSSAALSGQPTGLGSGGSWATTGSTAYSPRIVNASNTGTVAGAVVVSFSSSIKNPTGAPATFYIQMTTYTSADCTTGATDAGTVAASTAAGVTVTANVDESLTFTVGSTTVAMTPALTSSTTGTGTSTLAVATNGTGYSIGYSGTTLTSGSNTITALATKTAAATGGPQFGINLMLNTAPAVGATKTGSGTIAGNYNTVNSFTFIPAGEPVATGTNTSDTYTVSYIANIAATQAPGAYTATANYVATATF